MQIQVLQQISITIWVSNVVAYFQNIKSHCESHFLNLQLRQRNPNYVQAMVWLYEGKYHCTADLQFHWFGFNNVWINNRFTWRSDVHCRDGASGKLDRKLVFSGVHVGFIENSNRSNFGELGLVKLVERQILASFTNHRNSMKPCCEDKRPKS